MSHGVVCKYHYRGKLSLWLTSVTVWLILREGVAKSPCRCGSIAEIYTQYNALILTGKLWTYLADLNEQAQTRLDCIIAQMKEAEEITEELKSQDQMAW